LARHLDFQEIDDGWINVTGADGDVGGERFCDVGGPFDEAWDANATFPKFALMTAENGIGTEGVGFGVVVHPGAIIAVKPEHCLVGDAEFAEASAERAHAPIDADHFAIIGGATSGF